MRVLVLGLWPSYQQHARRGCPAHIELSFGDASKNSNVLPRGNFDTVISMTKFASHQREETLERRMPDTPLLRCTGGLTSLKSMLASLPRI